MEHASEALIMAFAVLIFVLALSISISSFSIARQTAQVILDRTDRQYDYTYIDYDISNGRPTITREVGMETIIPTLYRAYKENYIIRFYESNGEPLNVYQKKVNRQFNATNEINLENETIANQEKATLFIDNLLYKGLQDDFNNSKDLHLNGFYDKIKEMKFKEELGIYYIEDRIYSDNEDKDDDLQYTTGEVSDINKTEKRVITYTRVN